MSNSEALKKAAQRVAEAMSNEAAQNSQREQGLLNALTNDTSGQEQNGSNNSTETGSMAAAAENQSAGSGTGIHPDSLMAQVMKTYPDLTEEEIREAAGGLL